MTRLFPAALLALLLAACSEGDSTPAGISTATRDASPSATSGGQPVATRTAAPAATAELATGTPTEVDEQLAALAGEDPAVIAGAMDALVEGCTDERGTLGEAAERTWRILNEQRGLNVPVVSLLNRVIVSLPTDGREVACESLFASVITELSR